MGMFDYINCNYPLPVKGAPKDGYQTKDTPSQYLDRYTIRADGSLWVVKYDCGVRNDPHLERANTRDVPCNMTGTVNFYRSWREARWLEFEADFVEGKIQSIRTVVT